MPACGGGEGGQGGERAGAGSDAHIAHVVREDDSALAAWGRDGTGREGSRWIEFGDRREGDRFGCFSEKKNLVFFMFTVLPLRAEFSLLRVVFV